MALSPEMLEALKNGNSAIKKKFIKSGTNDSPVSEPTNVGSTVPVNKNFYAVDEFTLGGINIFSEFVNMLKRNSVTDFSNAAMSNYVSSDFISFLNTNFQIYRFGGVKEPLVSEVITTFESFDYYSNGSELSVNPFVFYSPMLFLSISDFFDVIDENGKPIPADITSDLYAVTHIAPCYAVNLSSGTVPAVSMKGVLRVRRVPSEMTTVDYFNTYYFSRYLGSSDSDTDANVLAVIKSLTFESCCEPYFKQKYSSCSSMFFKSVSECFSEFLGSDTCKAVVSLFTKGQTKDLQQSVINAFESEYSTSIAGLLVLEEDPLGVSDSSVTKEESDEYSADDDDYLGQMAAYRKSRKSTPINTSKIETVESAEEFGFSEPTSTPVPVPAPVPFSPMPEQTPISMSKSKKATSEKSSDPVEKKSTASKRESDVEEMDTRVILKDDLLRNFENSNFSVNDSVSFISDLTEDLFIPLVEQYFGSLDFINHVKIDEAYFIYLNGKVFRPRIENESSLENLPIMFQDYILCGKWGGLVDLGIFFARLRNLARVIISDEDFAEDTVRYTLGLTRDSLWTDLFDPPKNAPLKLTHLRSIKIGATRYTVEGYLKAQREVYKELSAEDLLVNSSGNSTNTGGSHRSVLQNLRERTRSKVKNDYAEESFFSSIKRICTNALYPEDEATNPLAQTLAPLTRNILGSGALVLGAKGLLATSLALGPWGLVFGGVAAYRFYKHVKNNGFSSQGALNGANSSQKVITTSATCVEDADSVKSTKSKSKTKSKASSGTFNPN